MILIIAAVLVFLFFCWTAWANADGILGPIGVVIGCAALTAMLLLGVNAIIALGGHPRVPWHSLGRTEIVAAQDSIQTSGSYFLLSGYAGGDPTISFYYKSTPTSVTPLSIDVPAYSSVQVYQDSVHPYFIEWCHPGVYVATWRIWLDVSGYGSCRFAIHVPKGSVKSGVNFDAN